MTIPYKHLVTEEQAHSLAKSLAGSCTDTPESWLEYYHPALAHTIEGDALVSELWGMVEGTFEVYLCPCCNWYTCEGEPLLGTHPDFEGEAVCEVCGDGHDDE